MSQTVGSLSTTRPHAVKVFQRYGIDFCCGGSKALDEVCAAKKIDVDQVLAEIAAEEARNAEPAVRWDTQPVAAVIEHVLRRFHDPLKEDLPRLEAMADKVARVHGEKDDRLAALAQLVRELRADLDPHLMKEEQVLFPWILRAGAPAPHAPVQVMLRDHDDVAGLLARLVLLTNGFRVPSGACATWTALWQGLEAFDRDLREHIALENNVLFPKALTGR